MMRFSVQNDYNNANLKLYAEGFLAQSKYSISVAHIC